MPYSYAHPHPAVTTDVVLFTIEDAALKVLLVQRDSPPFAGSWALPGGFVDIEEDLEAGALRELAGETGVTGVFLEQLYTFGAPRRDPRERIITVAFYALAPMQRLRVRAGSDARATAWYPCARLPELAFDHRDIVAMAQQRLAAKLQYSTIALQFMPERFTLGELQQVYEIILGGPQDKRNFRKRVLAYDCLADTGAVRRNGNHRPARLYRVKAPGEVRIVR